MKNAIVTGANGFVGRHLVKTLMAHGVKVTAIVRNEERKENFAKVFPKTMPVVCPLEEISRLPDILGKADHDTVFYHLAWEGTAGDARGDDRLQLRNVAYTLDAFRSAVAMQCEGFVGAGSLMEYESTAAVYDESRQPGKANIYSTAKLTAHYMSRILAGGEDIRYVWPYITNAYGEDELSPRFLNTAVRKMLVGEQMRFSAATQLYDFIHVDDVAEGFYLAGEFGKDGRTYCIGSGHAKSLRDFIIDIKDIVNSKFSLEFGETPGISLTNRYFDVQNFVEDTGFACRIPFADGVGRVADAFRRQQ